MPHCEKCWANAYGRSRDKPLKSQSKHYHDLLIERIDNNCTPKEQAGQWWDEEKQCDKREFISQEEKNKV